MVFKTAQKQNDGPSDSRFNYRKIIFKENKMLHDLNTWCKSSIRGWICCVSAA